ncbi:MAG TPA: type VI secretion system protein, partial [Arenibaculum sp.]|nr:type VI secretion system protein [Arenibaculum sp.]
MADLLAPLAFLASHTPALKVVLAVAALAVLVGVALAVWWLLRRIYPEPGSDTGPEAAEKAPSISEGAAPSISEEFSRGMALLRRAAGGRKWRYSTPIVLCLGEERAGKGTLLESLGLHRPFGAAATVGAGKGTRPHSDCAWHLFDQGVALDLAGKVVLRADGEAGEDAGWHEFVRQLQRYRPERGLDGIVLAIPASDLAGQDRPSPEHLLAKGEAIYRRLWDLQQQTGLRLPVYVVVTKCDLVPGFQGFWRHAAARHGRELFGWSNANNLEAAYGSHLIDEAFAELDTELRRTWVADAADQDEPEDPDGMFLFPGEFQRLAEPLKLYLDRLFRPTAYHEAFFFRGLYFVGDCEQPVQPPALRALVPAGADMQVRAAAREELRRPLFGTDLFA